MYEDVDARPVFNRQSKVVIESLRDEPECALREDASAPSVEQTVQTTRCDPEKVDVHVHDKPSQIYGERTSARSSDKVPDLDPEPIRPLPKFVNGESKPLPDEPVIQAQDASPGETECYREEIGERQPKFMTYTICIICGLFFLWIYTISAPFIANALTLHGVRFWCSIIVGFLPIAIVVAIAIYALIRLRKTPKVKQFNVSEYELRYGVLKDELKSKYLAKMPCAEKYAVDNGFSSDDIPQVKNYLKKLRNEISTCYSDSFGWLDDFKRFQSLQDERAKAIIFSASKHVGIVTAACPWRILDMMTVVFHSTVMIMSLAKLYSRRISRFEALKLGCHWIVNIYVSGTVQNATEQGIEIAASAVGGLTNIFSKALGAVVGKSTEGLVNALLVNRLGRRAMAYFRPLC